MRIYTAYVAKNVAARKAAETDDLRMAYKTANNAVYGFAGKNPEKQCRIIISTNADSLQRAVESPCFRSIDYIGEGVSLCQVQQSVLTLKEPLYISATILSASKVMMSQAVYRMKRYWETAEVDFKVHYSDTDSVTVSLGCGWERWNQFLSDDRADARGPIIDTSSLPDGWKGRTREWLDAKSGDLGLLKMEYVANPNKTQFNPVVQAEFVASKSYSLLRGDQTRKACAKGVPARVIASVAPHEVYAQVRQSSGNPLRVYGRVVRLDTFTDLSKGIVVQRKVALSPCDTKAFNDDRGMLVLPFGYGPNRKPGVTYHLVVHTKMKCDTFRFTIPRAQRVHPSRKCTSSRKKSPCEPHPTFTLTPSDNADPPHRDDGDDPDDGDDGCLAPQDEGGFRVSEKVMEDDASLGSFTTVYDDDDDDRSMLESSSRNVAFHDALDDVDQFECLSRAFHDDSSPHHTVGSESPTDQVRSSKHLLDIAVPSKNFVPHHVPDAGGIHNQGKRRRCVLVFDDE